MNKVFLSGNLTRDVEVRYTQSGKAFARMGIAINRRYKDKESVDFFNLVAWEKTAEFCGRYLGKGSRVLVEGRLQTSTYENRDGVKVNAIDVVVDNIEFAGGKRDGDSQDRGNSGGYSKPQQNSYGERGNDYGNKNSAPPKRNDYDDFGGEPIDPDDTPF